MECSNFVTNGNRNYQGNYNNKDRWLSLGLLTEETKLEDEFSNKDRFPLSDHQSVIWEKESDDSTTNDESETEDKTTIKPTQENKKSWIQKKLPKRTKEEWINVVKDSLIFYSTAFSVLLSILSITAMMFLVPFFIDPAWSTLQADFDVNGTNCNTTTGFERKGRSNCSWSSCQEGCTKTVYSCWQIEVKYYLNDTNQVQAGRLFTNVKGCGYPPNVDCQSFFNNFGIPGTTFKCFPSRHDPTMVIIDLDLDQIRRSLVFSLAVPLPCLFLSLAYIVFAYQYLYAKRKQPRRPIASAVAGAAVPAMMDTRTVRADVGNKNSISATEAIEKERQRKFLIQVQKSRILAAAQILHSTKTQATLNGSTINTSSPKTISQEATGLNTNGNGHLGEKLKDTTSSPKDTEVLGNTLEKDFVKKVLGSSDVINLSEYEKIKRKELQDARELKYPNDITRTTISSYERMQQDRATYGSEKYKVMQYYQYYGLL